MYSGCMGDITFSNLWANPVLPTLSFWTAHIFKNYHFKINEFAKVVNAISSIAYV